MITDKDNTEEFLKELKKSGNAEIHVGILGKENEKIQMIAAANEFGAIIDTKKNPKVLRWFFAKMKEFGIVHEKSNHPGFIIIPERAAVRKAFDNNDNIGDCFKMAQAIFDKTGDIGKAIEGIGSSMVGKVQESYLSNIAPKNHPLTVAMKSGEKTLVNSGQLQQHVTYAVR